MKETELKVLRIQHQKGLEYTKIVLIFFLISSDARRYQLSLRLFTI